LAVDVRARFNQHPDGLEVGNGGGKVQRIRIVGKIADTDIRAALQQQSHAFMPAGAGCPVQGGLPLEVAAVGIDQVGTGIEQTTKVVGATLICSLEDGVDRPTHLRRAGVARLGVAGEHFNRLVAVLLADLMNGQAVVINRSRIEAVLEGAANGLDIARARSVEHPLAGRMDGIGIVGDNDLVDLRLEPAPAGEAVFARDR